jgi:3-hydroxyacyl-[acyl-carrier-protein] dehydratase
MILDFEEVRRLLPQSYPMLMIDKVTELEPGVRVVGQKAVSGNEGFFQGHFPGMAIMPAALVLEALAQATIVLVRKTGELKGGAPEPGVVYLFGSVHAKMQRPVFPGDLLRLESKIVKLYGDGGAAEGVASVDGQSCVTAEMFFSKVKIADLKARR